MIGSRHRWPFILPKDHYPEIGFERTLSKVILELITTSRQHTTLNILSEDGCITSLEKDRRIVSVTMEGDRRGFISSFSCRGVSMADLNTSDLHELADAVGFWLLDEFTLHDMKDRLPTLALTNIALATEAGRGVTARWNSLLSGPPWLKPECVTLIRAAANRPALRQLAPVVSIGRYLWFSRTLGYPFATIDAGVLWTGKGGFGLVRRDRSLIAEGTIEQVLDILEGTLPADIRPAIYGTADDLMNL